MGSLWAARGEMGMWRLTAAEAQLGGVGDCILGRLHICIYVQIIKTGIANCSY